VYEAYLLLRTRLSLAPGPLVLPDAIEPLIQAVYDAPEPEGLSEAWRSALTKHKEKMEAQRQKDRKIAERIMVGAATETPQDILSHGSQGEDQAHPVREDDDPRVHADVRAATRLGEPSIALICFGTDANGNPLASAAKEKAEPTKPAARVEGVTVFAFSPRSPLQERRHDRPDCFDQRLYPAPEPRRGPANRKRTRRFAPTK